MTQEDSVRHTEYEGHRWLDVEACLVCDEPLMERDGTRVHVSAVIDSLTAERDTWLGLAERAEPIIRDLKDANMRLLARAEAAEAREARLRVRLRSPRSSVGCERSGRPIVTTDQPASSLEEARDRLHKAIDDRADCLVIESLVDGVVAAARGGEFIRAVEAATPSVLLSAERLQDMIALLRKSGANHSEQLHADIAAGLRTESLRLNSTASRLRVLSQGGEGNGDNT